MTAAQGPAEGLRGYSCAQSAAAAVEATAGQKERKLSERRRAPLGDESRLEIGHEADSDAATEGHSGPEVEQKSWRRGDVAR